LIRVPDAPVSASRTPSQAWPACQEAAPVYLKAATALETKPRNPCRPSLCAAQAQTLASRRRR
jgi:hypothetical protein